MKKIITIALAFVMVIGLGACGANSNSKAGANGAKGEPIGTVNGVELSVEEYSTLYNAFLEMAAKQDKIADNVKNMLVEEAVIKQDLEKNKVEVTKEIIDKARNEMIEGLGGKDQYKDRLAQDGLTEEAFEAFVNLRANSQAHRDWYKKQNPIDEKDLVKYYDEHKKELDSVRVSHILVNSEKAAKDLKAKLDAGEDFAKLAKENSIDEMTKVVGGDLGEITIANSQLDPAFIEAVSKLDVNQVSEPVQTQFGYHLIKVVSKKEGLQEFKDQITDMLISDKYFKYAQELKDKADIKLVGQEESKDDANKGKDGAKEDSKDSTDKKSDEGSSKDSDKNSDDSKKDAEE